jgi:hypothetical protein
MHRGELELRQEVAGGVFELASFNRKDAAQAAAVASLCTPSGPPGAYPEDFGGTGDPKLFGIKDAQHDRRVTEAGSPLWIRVNDHDLAMTMA